MTVGAAHHAVRPLHVSGSELGHPGCSLYIAHRAPRPNLVVGVVVVVVVLLLLLLVLVLVLVVVVVVALVLVLV